MRSPLVRWSACIICVMVVVIWNNRPEDTSVVHFADVLKFRFPVEDDQPDPAQPPPGKLTICISFLLPRLPKLPCQFCANEPHNLGNLASNAKHSPTDSFVFGLVERQCA